MSIHIQTGKRLTNQKLSRVQSVPCKIHADCDTNVTDYFDANVKTKPDNILTAQFRGNPLIGHDIEIPKGYVGFILHESIAPRCDKDERKFHVTETFNKIRYWNWDKTPTKNDVIMQALDWIDIAKALHSPIETE